MQINLTAPIHMKNGAKTVVLNVCLDFEIFIWKVTPLSYSLQIHVSCAQEPRNARKPGGVDFSFGTPIPFSYNGCGILTAKATGERDLLLI